MSYIQIGDGYDSHDFITKENVLVLDFTNLF
jgi:hypothetical protein